MLTSGLISLLTPPWVVAADGGSAAPEGWTAAAPREELRPKLSYAAQGGRDLQGGFVIEAEHAGQDGWWTKTVVVKGGQHWRARNHRFRHL